MKKINKRSNVIFLFFDITLYGVYLILNPIYILFNSEKKTFNSADHSFLIMWSAHSALMNEILEFFIQKNPYFIHVSIGSSIILLFLGYYYYYFKVSLSNIMTKNYSLFIKTLIVLFTFSYIWLSFYLFFND